jgi:hypothetical protein
MLKFNRSFLHCLVALLLTVAIHPAMLGFFSFIPLHTAVFAHEVPTIQFVTPNPVEYNFNENEIDRRQALAQCGLIDSTEATKITLLVPAEFNGSLTVSKHPNFAWYVQTQNPVSMDFWLIHPDIADPVYTTNVQTTTSGTVRMILPPEVELDPNVWYRWLVLANCSNSLNGEVYASNYIKRVENPTLDLSPSESPLQRAEAYAAAGIWHDSLGALLNALQQDPSNVELITELRSLLAQVRPDYEIFDSLENLIFTQSM